LSRIIVGRKSLTLSALLAGGAQAAINISTQATQNMSCSAGVCTATAQKAYLNVNDVTNMLAAGDLKVVSAAGAEDIHIQAPFSWTSLSRLTLDAQRSVEFEKPVSVAGSGALTLITNDGDTGGDYWFDSGASVTFWDTSSSLIINGVSFRLINSFGPLVDSKGIQNPVALAKSYVSQGSYSHAINAKPFGTTFEGLGNTISNLTFKNTTPYANLSLGLFAQVQSKGILRDINLDNASVESNSGAKIAALAAVNSGTISRCRVSGTVLGTAQVMAGGLVGENDAPGVVSYSSSSASVTAADESLAGGLVGYNDGFVGQSSSQGPVTNTASSFSSVPTGGLVGANYGTVDHSASSSTVQVNEGGQAGGLVGGGTGTISNSYASGNITAADRESSLGGLAGSAGTIVNSYATGNLSEPGTEARVGGLAGAAEIIDGSFATGSVHGADDAWAGSLVGYLGPTSSVTHSYATGPVSTSFGSLVGGVVGYKDQNAAIAEVYAVGAIDPGTSTDVGGVIGENVCRRGCDHVHARAGYWDLDTTGITDPAQGVGNVPNAKGVSGLTDAQLKSGLPLGFDPNVWGQDPNINNGYPYLLANPPPKGNKGVKNPNATVRGSR